MEPSFSYYSRCPAKIAYAALQSTLNLDCLWTMSYNQGGHAPLDFILFCDFIINHHNMYISWITPLALFLVCVSAQGLTTQQIETVQQRLAEGATHRSAVPPSRCLIYRRLISHAPSAGSSVHAPKLSSSSLPLPTLCSPPLCASPLRP